MSGTIDAKIAELPSQPVHYLEAGSGETIVFLHGAGGRPPEGASFVPWLAERHRLLIPSRPGFDDTPLGACKTLVDLAEVMAAFVGAVTDGPVHVVAQSAGGAIGCWLAILQPQLVKSLVLSAPAAFAVRPPDMASGPLEPQQLAQRLYGDTPSWSAPPSPAETQRIARNASSYAKNFHVTGGNTDLLERLHQIAAPTLLLWATHDRMMLPESTLPFQERIRDCRRIFVYGAAHEMPISAGPRWVGLVRDFVERGETFVVNNEVHGPI